MSDSDSMMLPLLVTTNPLAAPSAREPDLPDPGELLCELDRADVAQGGLASFVKLAWPHVEPVELVWSWHLDVVCAHYEAVARGECRDLVVNVPPGCSKSTVTNVFFPAFTWLKDPTRRFMFTSYSQQLTLRDAGRCAALVNSDWFQRRWGFSADPRALERYGITPFAIGDRERKVKYGAGYYYTTAGGSRFSTMFGGNATGFHAHILVADDPTKPADIQNGGDQARNVLEKVGTRWTQTFSTRAADPKTFARVIIAQRLHENDLPGQAVAAGATHVRLPMEFEPESRCSTQWGADPRTEAGELLCPARFPAEEVARRKADMSARDYAAQYQQRPSPEQGALFQRAWFERRWDVLPAGIKMIMSVDATFRDSASSDFCVVQVWGKHGPDFFLCDQVRARMDISGTMQAIRDLKRKWPRIGQILIEAKANGDAIITLLRRELSGILPVEPEGGKFSRASSVEPLFRAQNVVLPNEPWVADFIEELVNFPVGSHDDQCDAASQALIFLAGRSVRTDFTRAMNNVRAGVGPIIQGLNRVQNAGLLRLVKL